jgi:hypothetical protein
LALAVLGPAALGFALAATLGPNSAQAQQDAPKQDAPETPPAKPGRVVFSHSTSRILGCEKVEEEGKPACEQGESKPEKSGTKIKLVPLLQDGEGKESRSTLRIELPNEQGKQVHTVELVPGNWELQWLGDTTVRDKFFVKPGDVFDIALETFVGVCKLEQDECVLDADKRQQAVEIPVDRGL